MPIRRAPKPNGKLLPRRAILLVLGHGPAAILPALFSLVSLVEARGDHSCRLATIGRHCSGRTRRPLSGESADVHDRIAAYSAWLKTASLPKLFIEAESGVFITGRIRRSASSFPNQHRVVVRGLHFVQEDSPEEIGRAIAGWLERI